MKNKKTKNGNYKKYWDRKFSIQETKDGGICLYCGVEIDVYKLEEAEKEHIIPQNKWANDSFNNLVLSCKKCNSEKGDRLPFQYLRGEKWKLFLDRVDKLYKVYKTRNKEKHKFLTLEGEEWEKELEDFISRNINDTRIIATRLIEYINKNKKFPETKVEPVKGSLTSYFRKQIFDRSSVFHYKEQLRSLTPYHHAIDAIVLAHFKSRGHRQLLEDLAKINQGKWKLKREYITDKQFNSLSWEIVNRWKRPIGELKKYKLFDEYTFPNSPNSKNAIEILEEEIKRQRKEDDNSSTDFLITDLKNIVEKRIPVQLEKTKNKLNWDEKENKKVEKIIIEVKGVLTEEEYHKRIEENLEDKRGNIHYPYISYTSDHKVKKSFFASEQPGYYASTGKLILSTIREKLSKEGNIDLPRKISLSRLVEKVGLEKLNSEYGEKYNFLIVEDREKEKKDSKDKVEKKKNYTIWDTSEYASGFGIRIDDKSERIKNIQLLQKKRIGDRRWLTKNYKCLVRPYDAFILTSSGSLEDELVNRPLTYTGTKGRKGSDNFEINLLRVGLVKDSKKNLSNYYPERGDKIIKVENMILERKTKSIQKNISSLRLLNIDILGKRRK